MSDLNNLFTHNKHTHPSKRLFAASNTQPRQRSMEPHKSSSKQSVPAIRTVLSQSHLPKRTLSKHHLKKQLKLYNNQILVCLVRKIFFMVVAILIFNFLATDFNRPILYSNILLALSQFHMHFDYDFLGSVAYRVLVTCLQIAAFALNFFYLLAQISSTNLLVSARPLMIVSANAALNYLLFVLVQPVVKIRGVRNMRTPYLGLAQKTLFQLQVYLQSFKTLYELSRPILCINLLYWLSIICYIIKTQQETLFFNIFTLQMLKAALASSVFLHLFLRVVSIVDSKIGIELLSSNKKEINLNLLRLSGEQSGRSIHWEIQKYVWSSCESFWDTQFLTHHYQINYDLLEDYMTREIEKLDNTVKSCLITIDYSEKESNIDHFKSNGITLKWDYLVEYCRLLKLMFELQNKIYLFYIVDQIALFQAMGTSAPVSMQKIHRGINKVVRSLQVLQESVQIRELRLCLFQLSSFLCKTIQCDEN